MKEQELFVREYYNNKLEPFIGKQVIKVLTGQRRVGKSFLLKQLMDYIQKFDIKAHIISVNKEMMEFDFIRDYSDLYNYFIQNYKKGANNYFFVDEIQEIDSFEKCIRSIYAKNSADIYITGSNADMLSGEIATHLSGRYVEIMVYPLFFKEYLQFYQLENNAANFEKYLLYGALPGLINVKDNDWAITDYLKGIYSTILFKDIVSRYKIRNVPFLQDLVKYLAQNTGNIISSKKISDFIKSQKQSVSPNLVTDYLDYLTKSFLVLKVPRSDIQGKRIFEIGDKYYFEDLGLRNLVAGYKATEINNILENIVCNHLRIEGYTVFVGHSKNKEVDFVCERNGEKMYVQVCYLLSQEETIKREFGNLLSIKDNYPKYVVSMDEISGQNTFEGINHMHIRDFLLSLISY